MKKTLKPKDYFDSLSQRYGEVPVCRQYSYLDPVRAAIDQEAIRTAHRKVVNENRLIEFIYSTAGMKRDGNVVDQDGWDLAAYRKNPSFLWCHERDGEPLGRSANEWLGRNKEGKVLRGLVEFLPEGDNPKADRIFKYYQTGFLNAVSASWKPLRFELIDEEEMKDSKYGETSFFGGIRFTRSEMLEVSACPVPADPDALQKRIQSGEIRSEEFVLSTPKEYVYEDGRKTGLFYLDAHEFENDSRMIVDMGANKPKTQEERRKHSNHMNLTKKFEQVSERIAALAKDGYATASLNFSMSDELRGEQGEDLFAMIRKAIPNGTIQEVFDSEKGMYNYRVSTDNKVRVDSTLSLPIDEFTLEATKPETDTSETRGAVDFGSHGRVEVASPEQAWNGAEARKRLLEWATAEDGEIDYRKFRKGFAWFDETRKDSLGGYKLPHHDIVENKFVSVRSGLDAAAQRVMQQSVDIPEGDYASVRTHLKKEFELFGETAPWERVIGGFYQDIHEKLRSKQYRDEQERDTLRASAQRIAEDLFPHPRNEPWMALQVEGNFKSRICGMIQEAVGYFTQDREIVEEIFNAQLKNIAELAQGDRLTSLQRILKDSAAESGIELDVDSEDSIRSFLGSVLSGTVETNRKLLESADRISRLINPASDKDNPSEESDAGEDVFQRILKRVEAKQPSRGSAGDTQGEASS